MGTRGKLASLLVSLALCISCLIVPVVAEDTVTLSINALSGSVEMFHESATNGRWVAAEAGQKLSAGWQLRTGSGAKVELLFPRDNIVILRECSVLQIDWLLTNGGASLSTGRGGIFVDVKHALSPGSEFQVQTPAALAVVRGTQFGAVTLRNGAAAFYGYRGKVVVTNERGTVLLTPGTTVGVKSAMAPAEPLPSGPDAEAFFSDCTGGKPLGGGASEMLGRLGQLDRDLQQATEHLNRCNADWRRFSRADNAPRMVTLYAEAQSVRSDADKCGQELQQLLSQPAASLLWDRQQGHTDTPGSECVNRVQHQLNGIYDDLNQLDKAAAPVVSANEKLFQTVQRLAEDAPGTTWRLKDTDMDGVADVDEITLGLDSQASNALTGFIELSGPPDATVIDYPAQDELVFKYRPLEGAAIKRYRLVLEYEGNAWQRTNVGSETKIRLSPLLGPEGMFRPSLPESGPIELEWYVVAELDGDKLLQHISAAGPTLSGFSGPALMSARRKLTVMTPEQTATVLLDLSRLADARTRVGDKVLVEGRISHVNALGNWQIDIGCNPLLVEFIGGYRSGLSTTHPVYFGELSDGTIVIKGEAGDGYAGISGDGVLFQLEFVAKEPGQMQIAVQALGLHDVLGRLIEANPGHKVELDILPARSVTGTARNKRYSSHQAKY